MQVTLNRQKLGVEDIAFGISTEVQTRGGVPVTITQVNAQNFPYDGSQTLGDVVSIITLAQWEAEASRLTAVSYATEAEDVVVNIVTSDGDGTYTYTPQVGVYSALHHDIKALASATAAGLSATAAGLSATAAGLSETAAGLSETNAQLSEWEAEASRLTAVSYATEAEDVVVNIVTSDGDGTYTYTPQVGVYSALHYAAKAATFNPALYALLTDIGVTIQPYDANTTLAGNTFNGVSQLVQLDGAGKLPVIDGSQLTGISVDDLTDVDTTTVVPVVDDLLTWNGSNWVPVVNPSYTSAETDTQITNRMSGFKNGIINPTFEINQYADIDTAPVAMVNGTYHIDRFKTSRSAVTATIQRFAKSLINGKYVNSIKCVATSTGTGYAGIYQIFENTRNGETVTVSAWVKSNNLNTRLTCNDGVSVTLSSPHTGGGGWELLTLTKTISASATTLNCGIFIISETFTAVPITTGDYIESTMWQLEDGDTSTKFEQRPVGLELSLCQRYYEKKTYNIRHTATTASEYFRVPAAIIEKRVSPTVTFVSASVEINVSSKAGASDYIQALSTAAGEVRFEGAVFTFAAEL